MFPELFTKKGWTFLSNLHLNPNIQLVLHNHIDSHIIEKD